MKKRFYLTPKRLAEVEPHYANGGESIGRLLMHYPDKEPEIWKIMGGCGVWKRWYLACFATLYRKRNVREYERIKKRWQAERKKVRLRQQAMLDASGESIQSMTGHLKDLTDSGKHDRLDE